MDIQLSSNITTLSILLFFIFLLIKSCKTSMWRKLNKNLPPSPPNKLPIIGHLHHLLGSLPHQAFSRLAEVHGPVLHLHLGKIQVVVISSREATKELLKVHDTACADRPGTISSNIIWYNGSDIFFGAYTNVWKQLRKICVLELLGTKTVKSFGFIRQDEASHLINYVHSSCGEPVNLTEKIFAFTSSVISRCAFGKVIAGREIVVRMMSEVLTLAGGFELVDLFPTSKLLHFVSWNKNKLMWMHNKVDAFLDDIVEEHKLKQGGEFGGEDVVDALLRLQRNQEFDLPITNENIKAVILDVFTGATDTSSNSIVWAMAELMRNPRVMVKVQAEIRETLKGKKTLEEDDVQLLKYLKLVIKETFRLHPPLPLMPRLCRDECTVNGYTIPIGTTIMFNLWSMGRNPEYWDKPEIFLPERFEEGSIDYLGKNLKFIPFGAGRRICPGMNFGLMSIEFMLAQLLYHFDWEMPRGMTPDNINMGEVRGITMAKRNDLVLVPMVRINSE